MLSKMPFFHGFMVSWLHLSNKTLIFYEALAKYKNHNSQLSYKCSRFSNHTSWSWGVKRIQNLPKCQIFYTQVLLGGGSLWPQVLIIQLDSCLNSELGGQKCRMNSGRMASFTKILFAYDYEKANLFFLPMLFITFLFIFLEVIPKYLLRRGFKRCSFSNHQPLITSIAEDIRVVIN